MVLFLGPTVLYGLLFQGARFGMNLHAVFALVHATNMANRNAAGRFNRFPKGQPMASRAMKPPVHHLLTRSFFEDEREKNERDRTFIFWKDNLSARGQPIGQEVVGAELCLLAVN